MLSSVIDRTFGGRPGGAVHGVHLCALHCLGGGWCVETAAGAAVEGIRIHPAEAGLAPAHPVGRSLEMSMLCATGCRWRCPQKAFSWLQRQKLG